ncbi:MAG: homoserine dehydrogenase, partial [Firmicutes bacterium]|nr:homoserine dehydrogenase [Bacillota bacterium]
MGKEITNIGLLGLGTVGTGVVKILQKNGERITTKAGSTLRLKKVLVRDPNKSRDVELEPGVLTDNPQEVLNDEEIDLVVEVMGGIEPAREYIRKALQNGKYVVTANKDLIAQYGSELFRLAKEKKCNIYYEASVGGGIPLIRPLKHCLAANRITRLMGILNGTTNYILTKMSLEGMDYAAALSEAQAKGFAEADPSNDLEGKDAAYKLAILSSLAFSTQVSMENLQVEGITGVTQRDILYAKELGYVIKLLAVGEDRGDGLSMGVHPTLVPDTHPLTSVYYEFNALFVEGDAVGEVMFYGPGAGELPTGSAVVADIIDAARAINHAVEDGVHEVSFNRRPVLP